MPHDDIKFLLRLYLYGLLLHLLLLLLVLS